MAKKIQNMTDDERIEYYKKQRIKETIERVKVAKQVPEHLAKAAEELALLANEVACDALYNGGPRYIACDLFHELENKALEVKRLYVID